jgi:outer membrane receptor protein involved in Fe transport
MRKRLVGHLAGVALAVGLASPAHAQRTTGTLVGTVKDDTGGILPGVTVSLSGEKIVGTQTSVTNEQGFYRFAALPPGTYEVDFSLSGFAKLRRQGVKVGVGTTEEVSVALKVTQLQEEVTVTADSPVVDTQTNQVSTNYDKDWVRNAPVPRFSMFDLLAAAPGVSQSSQGATTMSAFGSGTDENSFQIDGTNLTAPSTGEAWPYPNTDAIEEIEVLALGAPAEYGNVTGAVFNVVTRQGSNAFHGDANFYYQSDGLTSRNTTAQEECSGVADPEECLATDGGRPFHREQFHDATFQISGPIKKDKLWFFASYQYQRDAKTPVGVDPRFFTNEKADRVFGKLNWQISPKHKLGLGYHDDFYDLPYTPSANAAPSTVGVNYGHNPTPNLMYTGVLSEKTVVEARVAGFWGNDHAGPILEGEPRVKPRFYDLDTGQVTGGVYYWYDDETYQGTASVKVSHFADKFLGSSHDFKFGVQYLNGGVHNAVLGYNDLIYTYNYTDYYGNTSRLAYGYQYQPFSYGGTTTGLGVFLDDTVRVGDRLTLNLGARFDHNTAKIPDLDVRDQAGNPTGETVAGRELYTWDVISPRVGFNFKLTADGKTVLKAHYGRYYRSIVTAEYSNTIGVSPHVTRAGAYDLEAGAFVDPEVSEFSQNQAIGSGYENPYTDQFAASLERELIPDLGLSLHYINKRSRRGPAWRDVVGQYEDVTILDDVGPDATGQPVTVQRLLTDPAERFFELSNNDAVKTDTHAFTGQLIKRMSKGWQLVLAYTHLDSKGVLPSTRLGLLDAQRATARFSDFGQDPNDFVNAGGKLLGDRPHTFKTQLVVQLPAGFLVGANYLFQSGRAWARRSRIAEPDLGFPTAPEINIEERDGGRRVPDQSMLDLRLQKNFSLGEQTRFSLFADALNLFNTSANQGVLSRFVDQTETFGVPGDFILPRRLMLGAKLTF